MIIPQTPIFLPDKSKRIYQHNVQENQTFNGRKQLINNNSNQEFILNPQNQQQYSLGIHLDIDQQSNEINIESFLKQNTIKDAACLQDILKADTPEKKRIFSQQKIQIDHEFNDASFNSYNNRNFGQSPDSNIQNYSIRQNSTQQDKKNRQALSKQHKILKDKELNNSKSEQMIRDNHWVQPSSKSQKKFQDKRDQNLAIPQKGSANMNLDQINQKSFNRKRHNMIDSFANPSDSDEMDDEEKNKNLTINKIFEVQKKRMQDRLTKLSQQKELEKKNQLSYTAPYAINQREQEIQEYEEQLQEVKQQKKNQERPQVKSDNILNKADKNNYLFEDNESQNIPRKLADPIQINDPIKTSEPIKQVDLFKNTNFNENIPQKTQTTKPFVNIVIPDKTNIPPISINGESTPLEKTDDILQPPPAPKASAAPSGGLFNNIQQKIQGKTQENKIGVGLFNNIQQPLGIIQQNQENKQNEQPPIVHIKPLINPIQGNPISNNLQNTNQNIQQVGGLFSQQNPNQNPSQTNQDLQQQNLLNDANNNQQKTLPQKQGLFGNLNSQQNPLSQDPKNHSQGLFAQQNTVQDINAASSSSQQTFSEGLLSNKGLPPKKKLQSNSDNSIVQNGLFGNINPEIQKKIQQQIQLPDSGALSTNIEPQAQKNLLFGNIQQNQASSSTDLNSNSVGLFSQMPPVQDEQLAQQKQLNNTVKFEKLDQNEKLLSSEQTNQNNVRINQQLFGDDNQNNQGGPAQKPVQPQPNFGGGLFNQSSKNNNETKNDLLNNNSKTHLEGGLFAKNEIKASSEPKVGGLFSSNQNINEQPQIQQPQSNQKPISLFGNLTNPSVQNQIANSEQSLQGYFFQKQANEKQKSDPQISSSQGGLFGSNSNSLNKLNNEQPRQVISLFGNQVNVPQTNGGVFNTKPDNQLLDKPNTLESSSLPSKVIENSGQPFIQINNLKDQNSQEKPLFSLNNGETANQQSQGNNGTNSQSLFSGSSLSGGKLIGDASAQVGLFGQKNQPLIQNNSLFSEPKEQKFNLFQNSNNSGTGLFSNQNSNSSQKRAITDGQNSIFGNVQQQGGLGTGLFANITPQNIQQHNQ